MKLTVKDLKKAAALQILGDEPWLEDIHSSFALDEDDSCAPGVDGQPRRLKGQLSLELELSGCVVVRGHIDFEPLVPCSRCDLSIPVNLSQDVEALFKPTPRAKDDRREVALSAEDLEARHIVDGKIDVEELLNDLVQIAVPIQSCQTEAGSDRCLYCMADVSVPRVFSSSGNDAVDEPASPFAKLAELKNKK